jgi:hypothetical protein
MVNKFRTDYLKLLYKLDTVHDFSMFSKPILDQNTRFKMKDVNLNKIWDDVTSINENKWIQLIMKTENFRTVSPGQIFELTIDLTDDNQMKLIPGFIKEKFNVIGHANIIRDAVLDDHVIFDNVVCTFAYIWDAQGYTCDIKSVLKTSVSFDEEMKLLFPENVELKVGTDVIWSTSPEKTSQILQKTNNTESESFTESLTIYRQTNPHLEGNSIGSLNALIKPLLADLSNPAKLADINYLFDIKRSGDAFQVITCEALNKIEGTKNYIFATIDRLAFLHARIRNIPCMYFPKPAINSKILLYVPGPEWSSATPMEDVQQKQKRPDSGDRQTDEPAHKIQRIEGGSSKHVLFRKPKKLQNRYSMRVLKKIFEKMKIK